MTMEKVFKLWVFKYEQEPIKKWAPGTGISKPNLLSNCA